MMTLKEFGEKLEELNQAYNALKRKYKKPKIGEIIEVAGMRWKVLNEFEEGYLVIANEFYGKDREFNDSCNDWKTKHTPMATTFGPFKNNFHYVIDSTTKEKNKNLF